MTAAAADRADRPALVAGMVDAMRHYGALQRLSVVEVGFEPTRALPPYRISSAAH